MKPFQAEARDLRLADTVQVNPACLWNTAIVKQITDHDVILFRPYGTTADFAYTGGVICYVGIEEYSIPGNSQLVTVLDRKELR
jgi:hypothetical protein